MGNVRRASVRRGIVCRGSVPRATIRSGYCPDTLKTDLSEIDGALNIADDIIIYAQTTKEHDEILTKVLSDKRINTESVKMYFRQRRFVVFWHEAYLRN